MVNWLLAWDESLFHWINQGWSNHIMDVLMPLIRNKYFWIPLYLFIISFFAFNFGKKFWYFLVFGLLTIAICDNVSSKLIKETFERPRPCKTLEEANILIHCGSGYSFTSTHATNHFGIGTFFLLVLAPVMKRWKYLFWLWAGFVSLAQVYVGVHYPLDIFGGALVGMLVGLAMYSIYRRLTKAFVNNKIEAKTA